MQMWQLGKSERLYSANRLVAPVIIFAIRRGNLIHFLRCHAPSKNGILRIDDSLGRAALAGSIFPERAL